MRDLRANQQIIFFKNYVGEQEVRDGNGYRTGVKQPVYSSMQTARITVSPAYGSSDVETFGSFTDYDRTMTTSNTNLTISEDSILWIEENDLSKPHDYIVKKVSKWKNSCVYAISKVDVKNG